MHSEYVQTTIAGLVLAAGLLLLDLLAPGVARFGALALLAAVIIPAVLNQEEV